VSNRYEEFMSILTDGWGCDDCPLYRNGFCNEEIGEDNPDNLSCGEVLYRYLNPGEEA